MLVRQDKEDRGSVSSILLSSFFNAYSTSAGIAGIMTDAHQFAVVLVETLFNSIEEVCLVKFEEPTDDCRATIRIAQFFEVWDAALFKIVSEYPARVYFCIVKAGLMLNGMNLLVALFPFVNRDSEAAEHIVA